MKYFLIVFAFLALPFAQGETYLLDKKDYVINLERSENKGEVTISFLPGGMSNYQVTLPLLVNEPPYPMNQEIYGLNQCVIFVADKTGSRKPKKGDAAIKVTVKNFKACFKAARFEDTPSDFTGVYELMAGF